MITISPKANPEIIEKIVAKAKENGWNGWVFCRKSRFSNNYEHFFTEVWKPEEMPEAVLIQKVIGDPRKYFKRLLERRR